MEDLRRLPLSDGTPLGALLMREGLLTEAQLDAALSEQGRSGKQLGRILIESGTISETDLVRTLAKQVGLEYLDLGDATIDPSAVSLVSEAMARRYQAIAVAWEDGKLVVAMADPSNVFALDDIRAITGHEVKTVVASPSELAATIDRYFRLDTEVDTVAQAAADEFSESEDLGSVNEVLEDAPIVKFVNLLVTQAVNDRASDIHVEPTESDLRIRFRIDGVLHEVMRSPRSIQAGVISRLKVMADINIAERRIPQDGRISLKVGGRAVDLRVATLPTVYGEKVVMRILDKGNALLRLEDLGFLTETHERFASAYHKPYGTILVTGPTGSGKSTTLYATLNLLNEAHRNIITVEDPVEYRLAGINQVQVHPKAGLTFASALRAILRSDPDVILVGEIRDRETAVIAIEAALTGHLVLSTLHTNSAASTPMRLVEMGVEPFLVTSALDCVVAQRLARRLCDHCKEAYQPTEAELVEAGWAVDELSGSEWPVLQRAVGCSSCGRTGYKGRFAIHEVMLLSEEIERMIIERRSTDDVSKMAVMEGMIPLKKDGLRKVALGYTTLEEIFRVVA
ncbi:MAG TPA: ATPase, T2SS/T4P/T4SS family [Acidimicrobiia bacterium]|jgi:type IV pilus assembly protein PilB|nr:ATPase, T2SS/T4P/T4SS family [Acidimicrobiia bacterium]